MTDLQNSFGRVAVLYGGVSSEREVSLVSGQAIYEALVRKGVDVIAIDVCQPVVSQLIADDFDTAFVALHGTGGEDGCIQGVLELMGIPYTGSGVLASAIAMDKMVAKKLWLGAGLPTAPAEAIGTLQELKNARKNLGGKVVVKPINEGSSFGVTVVSSEEQELKAMEEIEELSCQAMAEKWLSGSEYTVAILDDKAMPSIRLQVKGEFYDFEAKYKSSETLYHCPSGLTQVREQEIYELAIEAFRSLGCSGWGRVDLISDENDQFSLLEVNTIPGMTSHSLVPMAAKHSGLDFDDLVIKILGTAKVSKK